MSVRQFIERFAIRWISPNCRDQPCVRPQSDIVETIPLCSQRTIEWGRRRFEQSSRFMRIAAVERMCNFKADCFEFSVQGRCRSGYHIRESAKLTRSIVLDRGKYTGSASVSIFSERKVNPA